MNRRPWSRLWPVLLVLMSAMPWRVALACAHEAVLLQQRCCCLEMRANCPHVETGRGACCTAVVAAPAQIADADADALPPPESDKSVPPPPAVSAFHAALPRPEPAPVRYTSDSSQLSGSHTYLHTARLRL